MSYSIGLVGLPNVGKSTLFQAITKKQVPRENYPFCTINPHVGTVAVPDKKLSTLSTISSSRKTIGTTISWTDIAGLVSGAHKGEGLGNTFLSHIRDVDAICQVVRLFTDKNVTHVHGKIDPLHDIEIITLELIMADSETVEKRFSSLQKKLKGVPTREEKDLNSVLIRARSCLQEFKLLHTMDLTPQQKNLLKKINVLTIKPILYAYNTDEGTTTAVPNSMPSPSVMMSVPFELELSEIPPEDVKKFLMEEDLRTSAIDTLIKKSYELLDLITFYTSGEKESRAWTLIRGSTARDAAALIHSDIADGFVKADILSYDDFIYASGWSGARSSGVLKSVGKDYIMRDGDVIFIHFTK